MRIRTDGKFSHREDTIEGIRDYYGVSKTRAMLAAAEDLPVLAAGIQEVLSRDDLTLEQRREIAETLSARNTTFSVTEPAVEAEHDL